MTLHSIKFWDFSNQLYDKDGVTEICLNLQEELEVDVNLVLFCYWIAYFKHGPSVAEWTKIFKFSINWQKHTVKPIRNARKSLSIKRTSNNVEDTDYTELRRQLKINELRAEKIQQDTIQSFIKVKSKENNSFSSDEALTNLSYYFSLLNITQTKKIKEKLLMIAEKAALM